MTTFNQTRFYKRIPKDAHILCPALKKNPQVRGRFNRLLIITPRKPNSALRKVGRVTLVNKKKVFTKIAGSGLQPQKFATVLIKGKGYKDTPSVKYSVVRGKYECLPLLEKNKKRSKYGVKNKYLIHLKKSKN
jgi:small subunit ribosomal protein S12